MTDKFSFDKKIAALQKAKYDLPRDLADRGQRFFAKNFDKQQWDGVRWQPRKKETKKTIGKPILVNTGHLRDFMSHTIESFDYKKIVWKVDVEYAKYLNYGTPKMVARPFLKDGKELREFFLARINFAYNKIMKSK